MLISKGLSCSFVSRLPYGGSLCQYCNRLFSVPAFYAHGMCVILGIEKCTLLFLKRTVPVHVLAAGLFCNYSEIILNFPDRKACCMCSDISWTPCLPRQSSCMTFSFEDLNHLCWSSFAK